MNGIWTVLFLASCVFAMVSGRPERACAALLESGQGAVRLMITLAGGMTLWSGLMEILSRTGDVRRFGGLMRRLMRPLFGKMTDESWDAVGLNMAANILGLGNAATPAGIRAAQLLAEQGGTGLRALAMLLALNNSSLQLIPATVMTLRSAAGAAYPADVWPATLLASAAATVTAVLLMLLAARGGAYRD